MAVGTYSKEWRGKVLPSVDSLGVQPAKPNLPPIDRGKLNQKNNSVKPLMVRYDENESSTSSDGAEEAVSSWPGSLGRRPTSKFLLAVMSRTRGLHGQWT